MRVLTTSQARRAFIAAETRLRPVPHAPEIQLYVADEAVDLWQKTEDELAEIGLPPPFWAFAWAGGQALARYILDHPQIVAGKVILDFASGSGLCGIAAMLAGAGTCLSVDIDPFAYEAAQLNAAANGVVLSVQQGDLVGTDQGWDVVFAGDVFYEKDMAARVFGWLEAVRQRGATVLIGDPGRSYLPKARLIEVASYQVPVTRALEDAEIKTSSVWQIAP